VRREWPELESDDEAIKNMAGALLVRAIRDIVRYRNDHKPKHKKIYDDVYSWMYIEELEPSDDPGDQLYSFVGICGILGWDPGCVRNRVSEMVLEDLDRLDHWMDTRQA
jgi:hypothetical protein